MAYDAHKNFAYSTVATAPSPATSGTSLVVQTGDGAKFPTPPFNATIWASAAQPLASNAEVVRVTAIATDTLTITRAQESSTARTVIVGDQIAATITAKVLTDIESQLFNKSKFGVYLGTLQNVTSNTYTRITFDTKEFDTNSDFDIVTNHRFVAPVAGFYQFNGRVVNNGSGGFACALYKNSTFFKEGANYTTTTGVQAGNVSSLLQLAASDFVEFWVYSAQTQIISGQSATYFNGFLDSLT